LNRNDIFAFDRDVVEGIKSPIVYGFNGSVGKQPLCTTKGFKSFGLNRLFRELQKHVRMCGIKARQAPFIWLRLGRRLCRGHFLFTENVRQHARNSGCLLPKPFQSLAINSVCGFVGACALRSRAVYSRVQPRINLVL
jgi:hypothetical protein